MTNTTNQATPSGPKQSWLAVVTNYSLVISAVAASLAAISSTVAITQAININASNARDKLFERQLDACAEMQVKSAELALAYLRTVSDVQAARAKHDEIKFETLPNYSSYNTAKREAGSAIWKVTIFFPSDISGKALFLVPQLSHPLEDPAQYGNPQAQAAILKNYADFVERSTAAVESCQKYIRDEAQVRS
jgi:hypothetical protein